MVDVTMFDDIKDADERQQAWVEYLDGGDARQARKLAKSANDVTNRNRVAGPIVDGERPLISDLDMNEFSDGYLSLALDYRSDMDRESDWDRQDKAYDTCEIIRSLVTPKQWNFLCVRYGLDGVEKAENNAETAKRCNMAPSGIHKTLHRIRRDLSIKQPELFDF